MFEDVFEDAFADAFAEMNEPVAGPDEARSRPEERSEILIRPGGGLYSSEFMELFQRNASAAEGDAFDLPDPPTGGFILSPRGSADASPEASPTHEFSGRVPSSDRKVAGDRAVANEEADELLQVIDLIVTDWISLEAFNFLLLLI